MLRRLTTPFPQALPLAQTVTFKKDPTLPPVPSVNVVCAPLMQVYVRSHGRTETSYHTKASSVSGLAEAGNSSGSRGSLLVRNRPQTIPHSTGDYTLPPSSRPSLIPLAQSIVLFNKKKSEKKYPCAYQSLLLTNRRPQRY